MNTDSKERKRVFCEGHLPEQEIYEKIHSGFWRREMKIDIAEKKLINSIEKDEWTSVRDLKSYKKILREAASKTMRKDKRMNIRIAQRDLDGLKAKALEQGIPYQTLVSSILHKYIIGKLKEKDT